MLQLYRGTKRNKECKKIIHRGNLQKMKQQTLNYNYKISLLCPMQQPLQLVESNKLLLLKFYIQFATQKGSITCTVHVLGENGCGFNLTNVMRLINSSKVNPRKFTFRKLDIYKEFHVGFERIMGGGHMVTIRVVHSSFFDFCIKPEPNCQYCFCQQKTRTKHH